MAESVVAREEAASERAFDPSFRGKAKELLAALPMAALEAQTGEDGLGLSALGDSQADLVYTPLRPCRILDTRKAGGALVAGTMRNFLVTGTNLSAQGGKATGCGVPYGPATAAVINFVAVSPEGPGDLRITPFGTPMPLASIINYAAVPGLAIANGPAVSMCDPAASTCSADITILADASAVELVADVQGYYRRVSTGGVSTALLADGAVTAVKMADGAVTAPKIGTGVVVRSLNGETDVVTLEGTNGLGVSAGAGTVTVTSNATAANAASTIVGRDGTGSFSAGSVALAGSLALPNTTSTSGTISLGGERFLHNLGIDSVFVGSSAGSLALVSSPANSAVGYRALYFNTSGGFHSAFGTRALFENSTGNDNSAFGYEALYSNTTANGNSAFGYWALRSNIGGGGNSAVGHGALGANTNGGGNSALGYQALYASTGSNNVALGYQAGFNQASGNDNVYIANSGVATESGVIHIGTVATHTATYIAGISGQTSASGVAVYVNSDGKLGTTTSSARYKEHIADMDAESDVLLKLRPVSFYYRPELDETHLRQYGLVAEEVAEVAPGLVAYDRDGVPQTVRYHFVNAMLLNEVQKQMGTIERQEAKIQDLEARLATLEAALARDR